MNGIEWVGVALVIVLSAARMTRLWTYDDFPPVKAIRHGVFNFMAKRKWLRSWTPLTYCPYCVSFWITLAVVLSGWLSDWHIAWWVFNGSMGLSYLSAILTAHDGDDEDEDDD